MGDGEEEDADLLNTMRGSVYDGVQAQSSATIAAECAAGWATITEALAQATNHRTYHIHLRYYAARIIEHVEIYRYNFSEADHVKVIELLLAILVEPQLDDPLRARLASTVSTLLKKEGLLHPRALTIAWRPLFDLLRSLAFPKARGAIADDKCISALATLIRYARKHFSATAPTEIAEACRSYLCNMDHQLWHGMAYLYLFSPTHPESWAAEDPNFLANIPELLELWKWKIIYIEWDYMVCSQLVSFAQDNIGRFDWTPHLPMIFTHILRSCGIPVGTNVLRRHGLGQDVVKYLLPRNVNTLTKPAALVVYMITPENTVLNYLEDLFKSLLSFFHPSNNGDWTSLLVSFLSGVVSYFMERLSKQAAKPASVAPQFRLTDKETKRFVDIVFPIVQLAVFSKSVNMVRAGVMALRQLAYLAPKTVLPAILERVYPALETVMESHQTVAMLGCLASTAEVLFSKTLYEEGALHLVPLLTLSLPGIDPNDFIKTHTTMGFYQAVFAAVPLVDCSDEDSSDLPELEAEIYARTSGISGWLRDFLDRVLGMLDLMVPGSKGKGGVENTVNLVTVSVFNDLLPQLSPKLFRVALEKVFEFVRTRNVLSAAKQVALMCGVLTRTDPEQTLALLVPHLAERIVRLAPLQALATEEHVDREQVDGDLHWCLHILSRAVKRGGITLVAHRKDLLRVLHALRPLASHTVTGLFGKLLRHALMALTTCYVPDRSILTPTQRKLFDEDPRKAFALRGQRFFPYDEYEVSWHIPAQEEIDFAFELLQEFLLPALVSIEATASFQPAESGAIDTGADTTSEPAHQSSEVRNAILRQNLTIVYHVVRGTTLLLPETTDPATAEKFLFRDLDLFKMWAINPIVFQGELPAGCQGLRARVADAVHGALGYLFKHNENDVLTLNLVTDVINELIYARGVRHRRVEGLAAELQQHRMLRSNPILKKRFLPRFFHLQSVFLEYMQRVRAMRSGSRPVDARHQRAVQDLFDLSVSLYAEVRKHTQPHYVNNIVSCLTYAGKLHEQCLGILSLGSASPPSRIKGALFILQLEPVMRFISNDWSRLTTFLRALSNVDQSESESIQKLVSTLDTSLARYVGCTWTATSDAAFSVMEQWQPNIASRDTFAQSLEAWKAEKAAQDAFVHEYYATILSLVRDNGERHWRYEIMFSDTLYHALSKSRQPSAPVTDYLTGCLTNASPHMRDLGVDALKRITDIDKIKRPKVALGSGEEPNTRGSLIIAPLGPKPDVHQHLFTSDPNERKVGKDAYEATVFVDKNYIGFNSWPAALQLPASLVEQQCQPFELSEHSRIILGHFQNAQFLEAFVGYFSQDTQEENKPAVFSRENAQFYKSIFSNLRTALLTAMKPQIERLAAEQSKPSFQRCAAEILAGLIRGSKHWPYDELQEMWAWTIPVLEKMLPTASVLTVDAFRKCIEFAVFDRDPRRLYPLSDFLLRDPFEAGSDQTAFALAARMAFSGVIIEQLAWRGHEAAASLLSVYAKHLSQSFKLVRDHAASLLGQCFGTFAIPRPEVHRTSNASLTSFFKGMFTNLTVVPADATAKAIFISTVKTTLTIVMMVLNRSEFGLADGLLDVFPVLFTAPEMSDDPELRSICLAVSVNAAKVFLHPSEVQVTLQALLQAGLSTSWHARLRVLSFLQVFVFRNLFLIPHAEVVDFVVKQLTDERLEVRDLAKQTLSGFVRCGLVADKQKETFSRQISKMRKAVGKQGKGSAVALTPDQILQKHGFVLGLSAWVLAFPYSLPDWMPAVLVSLADCVNDPEPIRPTVKATMSEFWRTHRDTWHQEKAKFTDDQLDCISELLIGPSYYA
eukprot:m.886679 g.886679  ORF g.886679 m.886679 type:complete len:1821 (+) comp59911_c0_seq1:527-5989(+)